VVVVFDFHFLVCSQHCWLCCWLLLLLLTRIDDVF
jgi:hypothetical protein